MNFPLFPRFQAVLFDMDGVLFNSMPYHADAWHTVMERHGLHLSREEAYMHEGRTGAATINIVYQRQYGKDATPEIIESIYAEKSEEFNRHPEPERMPGAWYPVPANTPCWTDWHITFPACSNANVWSPPLM